MLRRLAVLALLVTPSACGPKTPRPAEVAYTVVTQDPTGIPVTIVNRTPLPIIRLSISGFSPSVEPPPHDEYRVDIAPNGGRISLRIKPAALANNELMLSAHALRETGAESWDTQVVLLNDKNFVLRGPTEINIVESDAIAEPAPPGYERVVRFTYKKQQERDAASIQAQAQAEAQRCQDNVDAAHGKPRTGKTKLQGRFKCVFGGAFNGTSNAQVVQLADGKLTATVTEIGNGNVANITWEGIVVGDEMRFAYAGLPSAGTLKIDPGGRALIGQGTSLLDTGCVSWTLTCTR